MILHRNVYEETVYDLTAEMPVEEKPKQLLILEDDPQFADFLRIFLESIPYQVTIVPDGASGIKQILARDFDIVLCDLMMPHLPGDLFFLAVQRAKPHLCQRFIFMSGHKADPKWDGFIRKIRACVLWKPFPMIDLRQAIEKVLLKNHASETDAKGNDSAPV